MYFIVFSNFRIKKLNKIFNIFVLYSEFRLKKIFFDICLKYFLRFVNMRLN